MKPTYIQVLIKKKKTMLEARIYIFLFCLKVEGLYFDVLHAHIFIQQNILGAMKL